MLVFALMGRVFLLHSETKCLEFAVAEEMLLMLSLLPFASVGIVRLGRQPSRTGTHFSAEHESVTRDR